MTALLVIVAAWVAALAPILALCRMAALADRDRRH
jgi:hypothetical protein